MYQHHALLQVGNNHHLNTKKCIKIPPLSYVLIHGVLLVLTFHTFSQMQVNQLEVSVKQQKATKQVLTKKQKLSRKSGEEFTQQDVLNLNTVNQQQLETQHRLDEVC